MCGDRCVVGRGARENLGRELAPLLQGRMARRFDLLGYHCIVSGVHDHRDALVILGRAPQHGRTADVNVLDRLRQADIGPRNGLFEGIQVHYHQVDRLDAVRANRRLVAFIAADIEQPAVDFRVERFYSAVQHFWKASVGAQVGDLEAGLTECPGRAARRNQLHPCRRQCLGQRDESVFVGNRK